MSPKFRKFQLGKTQVEALAGIKTFLSPKPLTRKWQRWKMWTKIYYFSLETWHFYTYYQKLHLSLQLLHPAKWYGLRLVPNASQTEQEENFITIKNVIFKNKLATIFSKIEVLRLSKIDFQPTFTFSAWSSQLFWHFFFSGSTSWATPSQIIWLAARS